MLSRYSWHIFYDCNSSPTVTDWLGNQIYLTAPFDLPLWFLRDLIIMVLLAPLVQWIVKRLKFVGMSLLFIAYLSRVWIMVPGFGITSFFYFTLGSYMALNRLDIEQLSHRYRFFPLPISVILMIVCIAQYGTNTLVSQGLQTIFTFVTVFSAFCIAHLCTKQYGPYHSASL